MTDPSTSKSEKQPASKSASTVKTVQNLMNEQEYQDLELSSMRRTIAKRLTASKVNILKEL